LKDGLLDLLACPVCRGALALVEPRLAPAGGAVREGSLRCSGCGSTFPVTGGVPSLLPSAPLRDGQRRRFSFQWQLRFTGKAEPDDILWGKPTSGLPLRVPGNAGRYLDCGCGSGEFVREVARANPSLQVVGLDFSESVRWASERDADIPNLHYVQGDITHPPFRPASFHFILCLGVLHHTADTRQSLLNVLDLLETPGRLSVWMYPHLRDLKAAGARDEYRKWRLYYFVRDRLLLGLSPHLGPRALLLTCHLLSALITPFGHILRHDVSGFRRRYRSNLFVLFDNLSALYQHRHRKEEVIAWFRQAGIRKVLHDFHRGGLYTSVKT
jgi:SAM-dependent methyltransferase